MLRDELYQQLSDHNFANLSELVVTQSQKNSQKKVWVAHLAWLTPVCVSRLLCVELVNRTKTECRILTHE